MKEALEDFNDIIAEYLATKRAGKFVLTDNQRLGYHM
jgi:hypothetical protein